MTTPPAGRIFPDPPAIEFTPKRPQRFSARLRRALVIAFGTGSVLSAIVVMQLGVSSDYLPLLLPGFALATGLLLPDLLATIVHRVVFDPRRQAIVISYSRFSDAVEERVIPYEFAVSELDRIRPHRSPVYWQLRIQHLNGNDLVLRTDKTHFAPETFALLQQHIRSLRHQPDGAGLYLQKPAPPEPNDWIDLLR
jgi:hypothetical protein